MAIWAARGLCAAGYAAYGYQIYRLGINPSVILQPQKIEGSIEEYVAAQAQAMGIEKNIIIIRSEDFFFPFGNNLLPGQAGISVAYNKGVVTNFHISAALALIQSNALVTWASVPLVTAIFTTFLLNSFSPIGACVAGLTAGLATFSFIHHSCTKAADLTALRYCTKEVNQAVLTMLQAKKVKEASRGYVDWALDIFLTTSLDEKIRYCEAHIK